MLGRYLGPYLIVEKLGEGGMGAVFKAKDSRLNRFVAIKLLPRDKLSSVDRQKRFVREAKSASALNHPNIVAVYDIGEFDGEHAIVMEYVAGRSLDHLISSHGLPLPEVLRLAIDIASGLEAAHTAGFVHRDIKPSNVIVSESGQAKLLDFGLAKPASSVRSDENDITETLVEAAGQGVLIGTARYMSPEQAERQPLDRRSDIFSFGAVLYEMVTGLKAFEGNSTIATVASILRGEPRSISAELPRVPRELERIVARCLRKDPKRRFQDAAELRIALQDLKDEFENALHSDAAVMTGPPNKRLRRHTWPWLVAAGLGVVVAASFAWRTLRPKSAETPMVVRNLTNLPGSEIDPAFSPDGNMVAFSWNGPQGDNTDIYVRLIDSGSPLRLTTSPAHDLTPHWSPDGRRIAFTRAEEGAGGYVASVHEVSALGGAERRIADGNLHDWSDDGRWLLIVRGPPGKRQIELVSPLDGTVRPIPTPFGIVNGACFSPESRWIYAAVPAGEIVSGGFAPAKLVRMRMPSGVWEDLNLPGLASVRAPVFADDIIFAGQASAAEPLRLYRAPMGGGQPRLLRIPAGAGLTLSRNGNLLAYSAQNNKTSIFRSPARPSAERPFSAERWISGPQGYDNSPTLSPDGQRMAFSSTRDNGSQIWTSNPDGSEAASLTRIRSGVTVGSPQWSPDGKWIAFDARAESNPDIWVVPSTGGEPRRLTTESSEDVVPCWGPDNQHVFFTSNRSGDQQLWRVPVAGGPAVQVTREGGFNCRSSPDGSYLYYLHNRRDGGLRRMPVAGGREQDVLLQIKGRNWVVLSDGIYIIESGVSSSLVPVRQGEGYFYRFATRNLEKLGFVTPHIMNGNGMCLSHDGRWAFYAMAESLGSDLMLVENFR